MTLFEPPPRRPRPKRGTGRCYAKPAYDEPVWRHKDCPPYPRCNRPIGHEGKHRHYRYSDATVLAEW